MVLIISAITLGFLGSFHCAGMCGPIAIALPLKNNNWLSRIISTLLYNLGRTVTYALLGLLFGLIGKGFQMAGFQQIVSIITGVTMILSVVFPLIFRNKIKNKSFTFINLIKNSLSNKFSVSSYLSLFSIGILNGLLPCGLVYTAVALAVTTNDSISGMLAMIAFGLATSPMLIAISIVGSSLGIATRRFFTKVIPFVIIILGILFILRGLNLGIKYISPVDEVLTPYTEVCSEKHSCCH
ncbi:MAG: sulfite exporter TauE/SafE family protein [Bacteroidia bacterium]|nr:sulfite exporter TauE/SafE family protein [Bacteroidia bacterium]